MKQRFAVESNNLFVTIKQIYDELKKEIEKLQNEKQIKKPKPKWKIGCVIT